MQLTEIKIGYRAMKIASINRLARNAITAQMKAIAARLAGSKAAGIRLYQAYMRATLAASHAYVKLVAGLFAARESLA
jgi:hypothetical protein